MEKLDIVQLDINTIGELLMGGDYDLRLCTKAEGAYALGVLKDVLMMDSCQRDTIKAAYEHGPLFDGDVPSADSRNTLMDGDYIAKVIVQGEDGYNACTYKGALAYKLIEERKRLKI